MRSEYQHDITSFQLVSDRFYSEAERQYRELNIDDKNTYSTNVAVSLIDVTFWSPDLNPKSDWNVDDGFTHIGHLTNRWRLEYGGIRSQPRVSDSHRRWLTIVFDKSIFVER